MAVPDAAVAHYEQMQKLQALAVIAGRRAWKQVQVGVLSQSWLIILQNSGLLESVSNLQIQAATAGASYGANTLAQQGLYEAPKAFVNAAAFGGFASDGRSLEGLLYAPVPHVKKLIAGGMSPEYAKAQGGKFLDLLTRTQVADAGRTAAGVDTASRPRVGYVRMLNPPSCSRCSILAGRFYRWNSGFRRHPGCDCVHVQTKALDAAEAEGLVHDPYEYFQGLSKADQDRIYTKAGAQAIRDGSDIFQVVNSRRGMSASGLMTKEGITTRGNFGATTGRGKRMTPEAIYKLNGDNRAAALRDLEKYGYILPGGQNPLGALRGQREGFGQLGHGGAYEAARQRIYNARLNGRDPNERYTMTAAERRLFDAEQRWAKVQQGINPFGSPNLSKREAYSAPPLTPKIAAQVENDYRRLLATNGEKFVR